MLSNFSASESNKMNVIITYKQKKRIQICEQNTIIYYDIKTPSIKADLKQQPYICCCTHIYSNFFIKNAKRKEKKNSHLTHTQINTILIYLTNSIDLFLGFCSKTDHYQSICICTFLVITQFTLGHSICEMRPRYIFHNVSPGSTYFLFPNPCF